DSDYRLYIDGMPRFQGAHNFLESRGIDLPCGSPDDPPEKETVCGLGNRKNRYFQEALDREGAQPYESTVEFIKQIKERGIKAAVISSSRNAKKVMASAGVTGLFDAVVDGDVSAELGIKGKPQPDIFLEAAKRLAVAPDRAAVVEDAIAGVEAGRKGGFRLVVGIDRGGHHTELKERGADIVVDDLSGLSWTASLPSALERKEEIFDRLRQGVPTVFLDYDGTLTPIVVDPAMALISVSTRKIIGQLAKNLTVVVMSGRALSDVKSMMGLDSVFYSGSHGFSIEGPGKSFEEQRGEEFAPSLESAVAELQRAVADLPGVRIEEKPFAIAVHYRQAEDRIIPDLERRIDEIVKHHKDLRKTTGKKIFELRPNMDWDKGKALLYLIERMSVDGSRLVPLYIGDDTTDEDAFRAVENRGVGILVSDEERPSSARYRLKDPAEVAVFLEALAKIAEQRSVSDIWKLAYEGFDPGQEKLRESLCTLGNGYFAARGAAPECPAGENHYPGTYAAGIYNRLQSNVAGLTIENESMVNLPNWLPLSFRCGDGEWFDAGSVDLLDYRQELDIRKGILVRIVDFRDRQGRRTRFAQRRFVHVLHAHVAGIETTITPLDWSGKLIIRSALDGRVDNTLVKRYRQLNNKHLEQVDSGVTHGGIIWLLVETSQSHIRVAQAARTKIRRNGNYTEVQPQTVREEGYIGQEFELEVTQGESVCAEKIAALYHSRDRGISNGLIEAQGTVWYAGTFEDLLEEHVLGWSHLWDLWNINVEVENRRMAQILNIHVFHLLQTVSPNTIDVDAGVPPRGLHGEAYRGLIMWDEIFIFPLLNFRMPEITRSLLQYRYRRLPRALWAAKDAGCDGALFPWQSGSNGREEAQTMHLNPASGRWIPDNSQLERHINIAVAYNIWHYYQVTGDREYLSFYGAEIIFELARFWAGKAVYNRGIDRYEICKVMGPDEFHDAYPDSEEPGIDNNAYTNIMTVWLLCRALEIFEILPEDRLKMLREDLGIRREELARWEDISRKMRVVFHDDGIISQFEGYGDLKEFDWDGYRRRYGDIHRLDRILEAEGDSPNRYKVSKQADVLMLFYLLSADELNELFTRLGYRFEYETIPKNIEYYMKRISHGSTLSRVVHSWVLARSNREASWHLLNDALESDISDIQEGTTHEGIHLGAMAGTVDIVQRCYTGIETRGDILRFNPYIPKGLLSIRFMLCYRGHRLDIQVTESSLHVRSAQRDIPPIRIGLRDSVFELEAGNTMEFDLGEVREKLAAQA
ncbi:MAG: trehalose-phosphatase, partial [Syntrophaceae bacterium]